MRHLAKLEQGPHLRLFSNSSKHLAAKSINRFLEDRSFESFNNGVQSGARHFWIDPKISHFVTKKSPSTKTLKRQHLVIWLVPVCWNLFLGVPGGLTGHPLKHKKLCNTENCEALDFNELPVLEPRCPCRGLRPLYCSVAL